MPMDPQLAAIYGTNQDETDVEKLAAAELAEELAEGEETDGADLSDEEAEQLAQQLLASEEEGAEQAAQGEEDEEGAEVEEPGEEEQEKLSEADYLGRVMAHAYTQELRKIAAEEAPQHGPVQKGKVRQFAEKAWHHAKAAPGQYGRAMRGSGEGGWKGALGMGRGAGRAAQVWGARGGTAAAVGAAGYAAHKKWGKKGKTKKSSAEQPSALDVLAERRALEILAENGIDPTQEQEKTSASENEMEALGNAVEQRAYALLQANGYIQEQK